MNGNNCRIDTQITRMKWRKYIKDHYSFKLLLPGAGLFLYLAQNL